MLEPAAAVIDAVEPSHPAAAPRLEQPVSAKKPLLNPVRLVPAVTETAPSVAPDKPPVAPAETIVRPVQKTIEASMPLPAPAPTRMRTSEKPQIVDAAPTNTIQPEAIVEAGPANVAEIEGFADPGADRPPSTVPETTFEEFEEEGIIETYQALLAILSPEQADSTELVMPVPEVAYELFIQDEVVSLGMATLEDQPEPVITNVFQELVLAEPRPAVAPTIDEILTLANDQSLEATLLQLSFCLDELAGEPDPEASIAAIGKALTEVIELLPEIEASDQIATTQAEITPELTEKLLALLNAVGYDSPQEVLIEFVETNGLELLIEAIRHLHQQYDYQQQEFLPPLSTAFASMTVDDSLTTRLGQAIVHYFFFYKTSKVL